MMRIIRVCGKKAVRYLSCFIAFVLGASASLPLFAAEPLVVYSERKAFLIEPLFKRFTAETGIAVQVLADQAPVLMERLAAEGSHGQADLLMTVDAGNLWQAAERGLLAPLKSPILERAVPSHLRDAKGRWFGLSLRARTLVYNPSKIQPSELSSYEALAGPQFKGKLCLRSSKKVYNQSLIAMQIARLGVPKTEAMVRGWVANLAAPPFADDTLVVQAVASGQCVIGIVNTYYFARLAKDDPKLNARLFWANQQAGGVHVNISGAGVLATSTQKADAQKLLEWLASNEAQKQFAEANLEYPVNTAAKLDPLVASWGPYKSDLTHIEQSGRGQAEAVKLMDRAGWK